MMVTDEHLPAAEAKTEASSHPPERAIVGGAEGLLHRVARGKS
jgi:hypothetical protein